MRERLKPACIAIAAWSAAALSCSAESPAKAAGLGKPGDPIEQPADALLHKRGLHAPVGTISASDVPANGAGI